MAKVSYETVTSSLKFSCAALIMASSFVAYNEPSYNVSIEHNQNKNIKIVGSKATTKPTIEVLKKENPAYSTKEGNGQTLINYINKEVTDVKNIGWNKSKTFSDRQIEYDTSKLKKHTLTILDEPIEELGKRTVDFKEKRKSIAKTYDTSKFNKRELSYL